MNDIIDKILTDICLNEKVSDGMFDIENNDHMEVLREYLKNKGIEEVIVNEFSNLILEKGKHPERQAYNAKGLLITFPTPEYKARAIARGTHFEKNPVTAQTNLYGGGQNAPQSAAPAPAAVPPVPATANASNVPAAAPSALPTDNGQLPPNPPLPPKTPAAGGTQPLAQGQLASEPPKPITPVAPNVAPVQVAKPVELPKKTPSEIAAEKQVIKSMLDSDNVIPNTTGLDASLTEQLRKLIKIGVAMDLNEAVVFLSKQIK